MATISTSPVVLSHVHRAAFDTGILPVGDIHKLHYEQYGRKDGKPVIFLHGGPGGNTSFQSTVYFDPSIYRVVLLDQRGAGKSTPSFDLRENTSHHLVADIETLRNHLQIPKWHMVFGGSWGSTLALLYSQTHPEVVGCLVLRGIFTVRKSELDWFYKNGPCHVFPELYEPFINHIPEDERDDLISAYYKRVTSDDRAVRLAAAREWSKWEWATSSILVDYEGIKNNLADDVLTLAHSRIELHYFKNGAWLEEGQLLKKENLDKIRHIPTTIVQGRYDLVCSATPAYDLQKALPESTLIWVPDAGHSAKEIGTQNKLVQVCDLYAQLKLEA